MSYVLRRMVRTILLLFGISVLCFALMEFAPGNFFDELRLNPQISQQTVATLRAHYGLDQPVAIRYLRWIKSAIQGDLGYSIAYNAPVTPLLLPRARNTLLLTSFATLATWIIGLPLGIWTASSRKRFFDRAVGTGNSILISTPEIVLALALLGFAVRTRIVPVGGMTSLSFDDLSGWAKIRDLLLHLALPVTILVLGSVAVVERHVRASVREVLNAPCIRAARGLGIGRARLLFRHVLPLAANPAISLFGLSLAGLLGGSLLVEVVCGWPGLGPLLLDASLSRDLYVVVGAVMFAAGFMVAGNFAADLLLLACDPRIRSGEADAT